MAEARVERRLAAILAADVAGYSRQMGADEVGTLSALKARRREIVDPAIAAHRGRIVKTTGDGMLVEFASAVDAVAALQTLRQVVRLRPGYGPPYEYVAASLAYLGQSDEARETLERIPPQLSEQRQRWQQRPPWMRHEDYALRVEGVRLAAGGRG